MRASRPVRRSARRGIWLCVFKLRWRQDIPRTIEGRSALEGTKGLGVGAFESGAGCWGCGVAGELGRPAPAAECAAARWRGGWAEGPGSLRTDFDTSAGRSLRAARLAAVLRETGGRTDFGSFRTGTGIADRHRRRRAASRATRRLRPRSRRRIVRYVIASLPSCIELGLWIGCSVVGVERGKPTPLSVDVGVLTFAVRSFSRGRGHRRARRRGGSSFRGRARESFCRS